MGEWIWQTAAMALVATVAAYCPAVEPPPSPSTGRELSTKARFDPEPIVTLLEIAIDADADTGRKCLGVLAEKIQSGELSGDSLKTLRQRLEPIVAPLLTSDTDPLYLDAMLLSVSWRDANVADRAVAFARDAERPVADRRRALVALVSARDLRLPDLVTRLLQEEGEHAAALRLAVLEAIGPWEDPRAASIVLGAYARLGPDLQPRAVELLTQRESWSRSLLEAIAGKQIDASALNVNQVTRLQGSRDEQLRQLVARQWGTVRAERNPDREEVVGRMRELLARSKGSAQRGEPVFRKLCGQCHAIHGVGQTVGPDLTSNGRATFDQLLSNVFDPSLVIGAAYQARTVTTDDGRILTGLLAEDGAAKIVLKVQGGKLETIPRDAVEEIRVSPLSLMPEGLEKQLPEQELADLFAFLTLDRPPSDPRARRISGAPAFE